MLKKLKFIYSVFNHYFFLLLIIFLLTNSQHVFSQSKEILKTPVKLLAVKDLLVKDTDVFLAQIDATNRAQLSFQIAGEVKQILVRMGTKVKQGETLAILDSVDIELALQAAQANYSLAKSQWERVKTLHEKKLVSADYYEQIETKYKAAVTTFEQSKTDLNFSKITAPFDGFVSHIYVKQNQIINSKQTILTLIDNKQIDVSFTLPINYVKDISIPALKDADMWVRMDSEPTNSISGKFKEITIQPNLDTNSYQAIMSIKSPKNRNLLKGMTGQVYIAKKNNNLNFKLPKSAWVYKENTIGQVWVMDLSSKKVSKVNVKLNDKDEVISGLDVNDHIVIAGIEQLKEGQEVKAWIREEGI